MKINGQPKWRRHESGITLVEAIMALAVGGLMMSGVVSGFIHCSRQAEWSSYSLAANSIALQKLEQVRAAKWDRWASSPIDTVVSTSFPAEAQVLDVPISGANIVYATNYTTIQQVLTNPPLKLVRVDCVWRFMNRGLFTNTFVTYRAPDQ